MKNIQVITLVAAMVTLNVARPVYASSDGNFFFDSTALEISGPGTMAPVDLTRFERVGGQLPGVYQVSVRINNVYKGSYSLRFVEQDDKLYPLLTPAQLESWSVSPDRVSAFMAMAGDTLLDKPLYRYIPGAKVTFDFSALTVDISVPQLYMNKTFRGTMDPARWENGIAALFSTYRFSGANTWQNNKTAEDSKTDSYFLTLNNGINLGAWRLRNAATGSWSHQETEQGASRHSRQWKNNETVLLRDIGELRSRLSIGQTSTTGDIFESVNFTGAQLASEQSMWPDNRRNFAPVIRGIAAGSARVTVRQNSNTIYETWVPAGAFEIDDLPSGGTNGDLQVTVTEDSGKTHQFTVAYSSLAVMLREGDSKYALSAGKYRQYGNGAEPNFGQFTLSHGFPWRVTGYGGGQVADKYQAAALGAGVDAGVLGAFSADVTFSRAQLYAQEKAQGQSYRAQYSKNLLSTGSTVTLAAYRYSTENFYTLSEQIQAQVPLQERNSLNNRRKNRLQLNLSQQLPDRRWGALYVTGLIQDYWEKTSSEVSLSSGYSNSWQGVSYTLNYTHTRTPGYRSEQLVSLNVSVPLSRFLPSAWANYSLNTGSRGETSQMAGLSGTALDRDNLSYSMSQSYRNRGAGNSGSLSLGYTGGQGEVNGGYNYSRNTQRVDYGVRGGVMLHEGGVTLSPPLGGNMTPVALVRVQGEPGIRLTSSVATTDRRGYAVVPYLSAYRNNSIGVDTYSLPDEVDIRDTVHQTVPSGGAVILTDFKVRRGKQALIHLSTPGGRPVPFGATVSVAGEDTNTSIVGEGGEVYLSGLAEQGVIVVQWGNKQHCQAGYNLGPDTGPAIKTLSVQCR
ncbi:fimbrial biogenesis outer membrane usher protein [Salmonella enterica subsp. enterica serovar Richmond]|nr:fimbrial biogenesis outer membrane usher protein [Salmonella enterica]EBR9918849.1 fimbrial biogenesis outer membrane usher protein [Salmonella enterica subsp. enterica serovar Richmond]EBV8115683.1 fimbrial biogenesis outer membrane usher protein [Salmonella enterica subsp. enterica serovar Baildon]EEA9092012.1 fimbrial biogenesis outer membrane usher protein [Salmonella enterica subsp. enterica]EAX4341406.1 fimbrial biogenesis outer membrane usher protein [Salmonella enterica]